MSTGASTTQESDQRESDQAIQRRANLDALKELGVDVYPNRFDAQASISAVVAEHGDKTGETLDAAQIRTRVAGRILGVRTFGKANFLVLSDGRARLQVYLRQDSVPERAFQIFKLLDFGDWVGVEGRFFRTKTNEFTVWASDLTFLSKCLLPLPEKWHGLTDVETRYRQRYLDLVVNPDSRNVFEIRSRVVSAIRQFLLVRGFLEVETPMMQPIAGGALARPFRTHHNALDLPLYLRIAPELYLKRLTVGGIERVFEINRNFRNEGISTQHNPEFTMLEFYWTYADYHDLMAFTEQMLAEVAQAALGSLDAPFGEHVISFQAPFRRLSLRDAAAAAAGARLGEAVDVSVLRSPEAARILAQRLGVAVEPGAGAGRIAAAVFEALCEGELVQPTFVHDFPTEVSPLSKQKADDPDTVERFELYIGGFEVANAFSELNDPAEQRRRFDDQLESRAGGDDEAHAMDEDYIRALEYGLPPTGGEGIGIDRLVMVLTNSLSIRDVILFPLMRPRSIPKAMRFELFVAFRYLLAPRRQTRVSLISLFSTIGVAVGVMALVIALALMTGLQGELRDKLLGAVAHVYLSKDAGFSDYPADVQALLRVPGVIGAAPTVLGKAIISTSRGDAFITVKGIDPALEVGVTDLQRAMRKGRIDGVVPGRLPDGEEERPGILLGLDLAGQLGVSVGDTVTLLTPQGTLSPLGVLPRSRLMRVAGIYSLGLLEFDTAYGLVSLDFAERLLSKAEPDLLQVRVSDIYAAPAIADQIEARLGAGYRARDWVEMNGSLFSALWLEKMGISIAVALIVIVGALNIISSLILMVIQKSRDIAILKTMGASSRSVMAIFIAQGVAIGIVGTAFGGAGGLALSWVMNHYKVIHIPMDVYQVAYVPFVVLPLDFLVVIVSAVVICFLSTIYPSRQASRLDPVQALRFE